jgi:hypothetical protein
MSTICHHTMSLDGFIAAPDDSMDWVIAFGEATSLADATMNRIGAILAGRRWYEPAIEWWNGADGIYGGAYGGPVFVLTHHPPKESASPRISFISDEARRRWQPRRPPPGTGLSGSSRPASVGSASRPGYSMRSSSTWRRYSSATASGCTAARATRGST